MDVAHLSLFMDVHLYLLEAGVVKVGPMLCPVLHSAPSVVETYKGEKLWVVVGITLQIIVDLHGPPLSQQCGMVVITITSTVTPRVFKNTKNCHIIICIARQLVILKTLRCIH